MADNTDKLVTLSNLSEHVAEIKRLLKQVRAYIDKKDDTKVDKVSGKQLSTNDLTTELLNKLNSLENYDDTAVRNLISGISSRIDTLVGESASEAIDNFNEILAFLNGVTDTQTLQGLISNLKKALENQIATKANKSHTHAASDITDFSAQVKTLQAADILSAEPTETTLTHTVNGTTIDYKIGELVRVPDSESETGFKFFQLHAVTDGKAVWSKVGTGSEGSNSDILISTIYIDQTITDPASMISGDINGEAIQAIRANSHRFLGKYTASGTMSICQLSDTDSTKFADGSVADLTGAQGDVFMRLPVFYTKAEEQTKNMWQIKFAYGEKPGDSWMTWGGDDLIGVYEAYVKSNKLYSRSEVATAHNINQANFKSYARARGVGFSLVKHKHQNIIAFLLYALYGNTCIKAIVGAGTDSVKGTGQTNSLGMSDTTKDNGNSMSINAWGLENWWGDRFEAVDNIMCKNSFVYITEDDGSVRILETIKNTDNWHYPSKLLIGDYLDVIMASDSKQCSITTGFCDGQWTVGDSEHVAYRSHATKYDTGGPICYRMTITENDVNEAYGTRIAFQGNLIKVDDPITFKSLTAIG